MLEKTLLIFMVILAVMAIATPKLRRAIISLGAFSLICSLCFLVLSAPDVAIAEAVIGSTISTVLYLIALRKYRIFTIYSTHQQKDEIDDRHIIEGRAQILSSIERFLISHELEPQIVYTYQDLNQVLEKDDHDLIIHQDGNRYIIYGNRQNYRLDELTEFLEENNQGLEWTIIRHQEEI